MMVVAVGITSEEVRSLASQAPAVRAGRLPSLKCLVVSGDAGLRGRLHTMSELGGFSSCEMPADAMDLRSAVDGDFQLVVQDNGRGIPAELDGRLDKGHGMASMKGRAKQLQGQCLVESSPGYGTVIRLTLPLEQHTTAR